MFKLVYILLLTNLIRANSNLNTAGVLLNARIQCEYKDKDGDSLVLNCTLITGQSMSSNSLNNNANINTNTNSLDTSGVSINSLGIGGDVQNSPGNMGSAQSSAGVSIRVGLDKSWRTPWESLSINHNIIRTFIWRNSKLSDLGEYAFKDLSFLQRLDLSYNKLQHLNAFTFKNFELDLIELDLSHNLFQLIPFDLFASKRLQNIEILRMNENPIVHLSRRPFELVRNSLKTIELNHCQIRSIDANTFDDMKQLESISLIGNHLRYLNELTFRDLNLRSFYVHDNPLVCDCHMRWLINYLKSVDYQQQTYETQIAGSDLAQSTIFPFWGRNTVKQANVFTPQMSVALAAQQFLKCDQPNSLKSKPNFLDINPDSFMCDVQISLRDNIAEAAYDLSDDAVLICDVYGDPEPNIYWSFGQKPIQKALNNEDDKYHINELRSVPNPNRNSNPNGYAAYFASSSSTAQATNKTSELRIKNLQSSDIGFYTCTAEILGSNNRKQITFNLKQVRGTALSGLTSASGIVAGGVSFLASSLFSKPLSNWTLVLLLAVLVSLIVFILVLSSFVCWKCRTKRKHKKKLLNDELMIRKEEEKLLFTSSACNGTLSNGKAVHLADVTDHHNHYNQNYLANESSTTLISNNKMSSSIRMAYPNVPINEIYANHSLLTTTSTTTGSYLANGQTIAIDTSNQTPRYHLLQQQQQNNQNADCYYDDLRYNAVDEHHVQQQAGVYSSPYRQNQAGQSYSPMIRRDDPTVPLYATLKPKLMQQQQQHQRQYSSNYAPYSTLHRSNQNTPPLPLPRRNNGYQLSMGLPPPPPPPPPLPPVKPKRTFEYVIGAPQNRDLYSESGAFLLAGEDSTPPVEFEQAELVNYQINFDSKKKHKTTKKSKQHGGYNQEQGSTTSLDEEDLDLNDLKDFEDVTFDNLSKPNEQVNPKRVVRVSASIEKAHKQEKENKSITKQLIENLQNTNHSNSSEQSLLLKSSDKSSSENTINNVNLDNQAELSAGLKAKQTPMGVNSISNGDVNSEDSNAAGQTSKIYEETEI